MWHWVVATASTLVSAGFGWWLKERSDKRSARDAHARNLRRAVFVLLELRLRLAATHIAHGTAKAQMPQGSPREWADRESALLSLVDGGDPDLAVMLREVATDVAQVDPLLAVSLLGPVYLNGFLPRDRNTFLGMPLRSEDQPDLDLGPFARRTGAAYVQPVVEKTLKELATRLNDEEREELEKQLAADSPPPPPSAEAVRAEMIEEVTAWKPELAAQLKPADSHSDSQADEQPRTPTDPEPA